MDSDCNSSCSEYSSEDFSTYSSTSTDSEDTSKSKRLKTLRENYVSGKGRKVYHSNEQLDKFLSDSDPKATSGVCSKCSHGLSVVAEGFIQLKHHGTTLKKHKRRLPSPKHPDRPHYRNVKMQNEWL